VCYLGGYMILEGLKINDILGGIGGQFWYDTVHQTTNLNCCPSFTFPVTHSIKRVKQVRKFQHHIMENFDKINKEYFSIEAVYFSITQYRGSSRNVGYTTSIHQQRLSIRNTQWYKGKGAHTQGIGGVSVGVWNAIAVRSGRGTQQGTELIHSEGAA